MRPITATSFSFHGSHSLLHRAELHSDNQFCLCRHVLEHVGFQSPQHVRTKEIMELLDLVLFRDIGKLLQETFQVTGQVISRRRRGLASTVLSCLRCLWERDKAKAWWGLLKALRCEKVKQVEELFQVVLKRRPSEQQLVVDLISVQNSEKLLMTLHCMSYKAGRPHNNANPPFEARMALYFMDTRQRRHIALPLIGCSLVCGPHLPLSRPMPQSPERLDRLWWVRMTSAEYGTWLECLSATRAEEHQQQQKHTWALKNKDLCAAAIE